ANGGRGCLRRCRLPRFFAVIIGIVVISLTTVPLYGQYTTASLGGTVTDETGAVLPGAPVTVNNVDTAFTENTLTDDRGNYLFPRLPVGQYQLTVERSEERRVGKECRSRWRPCPHITHNRRLSSGR